MPRSKQPVMMLLRLENCVTFDIWLNNAPIISIIKALLSKDYVLIQEEILDGIDRVNK